MRTSELNQLIESPERLQKDQINDLQELISEYPYFTSAQFLLTKAFFESENLNFEKQLRLSAAYAGDRRKLHNLLYSGKQLLNEVSESSDFQSAALSLPKGTDFKSTDISTPLDVTDQKSAALSSPKGEIDVVDEKDRTQSSDSIPDSEPLELDEKSQADQDFLDAQIMSAAIGNTIVDELETGVEEKSDISTPLDVTDQKSAALSSSKGEMDEDSISSLRSPISEESPAFDENQPHSFNDWLKHYRSSELEDRLDTRPSNSSAESAKPNPIIQSISDQAKQIQEKAEFYSAAKMAKLSVTESDDLVTETLAMVFEDQGKFDKAIKAYEKLRLKFPEKSVYFAGRIKAVKKKLKS